MDFGEINTLLEWMNFFYKDNRWSLNVEKFVCVDDLKKVSLE